MLNKSRGRPRKGAEDRRAAILAAATDSFGTHGYTGTTLRGIAVAASCDVALVPYYFGSKAELFAEAMRISIGPSLVLSRALKGQRSETAGALAHAIVEAWESPVAGSQLQQLAREAVSQPALRNALSQYLDREIRTPLAEFLGGPRSQQLATAVLNVIAGFIFTRYILSVPTSVAMSKERAEAQLAAQIEIHMAPSQRQRRGRPLRDV